MTSSAVARISMKGLNIFEFLITINMSPPLTYHKDFNRLYIMVTEHTTLPIHVTEVFGPSGRLRESSGFRMEIFLRSTEKLDCVALSSRYHSAERISLYSMSNQSSINSFSSDLNEFFRRADLLILCARYTLKKGGRGWDFLDSNFQENEPDGLDSCPILH